MPAEKILTEAICAALNPSLPQRIRINELPQMMQSKIKIPQLINPSFFIIADKGQQSETERYKFFIPDPRA